MEPHSLLLVALCSGWNALTPASPWICNQRQQLRPVATGERRYVSRSLGSSAAVMEVDAGPSTGVKEVTEVGKDIDTDDIEVANNVQIIDSDDDYADYYDDDYYDDTDGYYDEYDEYDGYYDDEYGDLDELFDDEYESDSGGATRRPPRMTGRMQDMFPDVATPVGAVNALDEDDYDDDDYDDYGDEYAAYGDEDDYMDYDDEYDEVVSRGRADLASDRDAKEFMGVDQDLDGDDFDDRRPVITQNFELEAVELFEDSTGRRLPCRGVSTIVSWTGEQYLALASICPRVALVQESSSSDTGNLRFPVKLEEKEITEELIELCTTALEEKDIELIDSPFMLTVRGDGLEDALDEFIDGREDGEYDEYDEDLASATKGETDTEDEAVSPELREMLIQLGMSQHGKTREEMELEIDTKGEEDVESGPGGMLQMEEPEQTGFLTASKEREITQRLAKEYGVEEEEIKVTYHGDQDEESEVVEADLDLFDKTLFEDLLHLASVDHKGKNVSIAVSPDATWPESRPFYIVGRLSDDKRRKFFDGRYTEARYVPATAEEMRTLQRHMRKASDAHKMIFKQMEMDQAEQEQDLDGKDDPDLWTDIDINDL